MKNQLDVVQKEKYDTLENEYDCVQLSWLFCCSESENCAVIIADMAEKLGVDISFTNAYYKQYESLQKLFEVIRDRLGLEGLSEASKEALVDILKDSEDEKPEFDIYQKLKDVVREYTTNKKKF
jgi:hypothetical protein